LLKLGTFAQAINEQVDGFLAFRDQEVMSDESRSSEFKL
jgi:hypothetical protein